MAITAQTDATGHYTISPVIPGVYSIEVSASGFTTITRRDLVIQIQQTLRQDFQMQSAGAPLKVNVTSEAPLLNTSSAELGNVIPRRSLEELPVQW